MQRVIVTGSSIKRTEAEAAGSVQVLTRDDIERTGQTTALGILTSTASIDTSLNADKTDGFDSHMSPKLGLRWNAASDNEFLALVKKYAPNNTVNYGGVGQLGMVYNPYVNSGKTRVSGIDFDASGRFKMLGTDVRLKLDGTYVLKYQTFSEATNSYDRNMVGTWDFGSRMTVKAGANVKQGDFDHGVTWNYASGYSNNSISSPTYCTTQKVVAEYLADCERVDHNTTVDYTLAYSGIKHVKLNLYVYNVFGEDRPIEWRDGWRTTSPQFRTFGVAASYTF